MIGQHVEAARRFPWLALLCLALGLALLGSWASWHTEGLAVGAILPITVGLMLLAFGRGRPFAARFGEEGIELIDARYHNHASTLIPYADLRGVRAGLVPTNPAEFARTSCALGVEHEGGFFWIPARLNVSSAEVFRFLAGRVARSGSRDIHPSLLPYLRRVEEQFGPDQVACYRAAPSSPRRPPRRSPRVVFLGLLLTGVIWMVLGVREQVDKDWAPVGMLCATFGGMGLLVLTAATVSGTRAVPGWKQASVVICPEGMAMVQGPVEGELRWPELLDIKFGGKPKVFRLSQSSTLAGIHLRVAGATIVVADIYERPLYVLHEQIMNAVPGHLQAAPPVDR